jgi:hypothetical protein
MSRSLNKMVTELFPEATYCAAGLDAGKWITDDYKFQLKCGFYTSVTTGQSVFVNGKGQWETVLNQLSELSKKYKEANAIGKG